MKDALRLGYRKDHPQADPHRPWFIRQIKTLVKMEQKLMRYNVPEDIEEGFFRELKEVATQMPRSPG